MLKETPEGIRVSLRSVSDVDVGAIAAALRRRRPQVRGRLRRRRGPVDGACSTAIGRRCRCSAAQHRSLIDGLVVVDKAAGWTSHDVVAKCREHVRAEAGRPLGHARPRRHRRAAGRARAGHPAAAVPRRLPKTYTAEVVLGVGHVDARRRRRGDGDVGHVRRRRSSDVRAAAAAFDGDILQVPPMVSACRSAGKRLHELARRAIEVEREAAARHRAPVRRRRRPTDPLVFAGRGRVLVGHLHPHAGGRPRHRPRRRRPPAQPAPHRHRFVRPRRGPPLEALAERT